MEFLHRYYPLHRDYRKINKRAKYALVRTLLSRVLILLYMEEERAVRRLLRRETRKPRSHDCETRFRRSIHADIDPEMARSKAWTDTV